MHIYNDDYEGLEFELKFGGPQVLGIYNRPPDSISGDTLYIQFADDISRIIVCPYRNEAMMARMIEIEISNVSDFEKDGK